MGDIENMHQMGLKGILYFYDRNRLKRSKPFWVSVILTLLLTAIGYIKGLLFYEFLKTLSDLGTSLFPNLLGFTLGGFSLIVGFASSGNIKKFTEKSEEDQSKGSFFQMLITVFSISILLQFFALLFCYALSFIIKTNISANLLSEHIFLCNVINSIVFILICIVCSWSILTIPYVVTNLFNFSQSNHLLGTIERIKEENAQDQ